MGWIYKQTERGQYPLWTVGTDEDDWQTDSDHDTRESAANRCAYLNGAPSDYIKLKDQNDKLKDAINHFIDRVEKGQVRSVRSYNHFKETLKSCES
jgi:hypothetical protein